MGLLRWITGRASPDMDRRLVAWRASWNSAAGSGDVTALSVLREQLNGLDLPDDDVEIEREMLAALQDLADLVASVELAGLPALATGHRIVRDDRCHFVASASMVDESSPASGQLLLTNRRAIFVGAAARTIAWHHVRDVLQQERDLVLLAVQPDALIRFRCNGFSDAMRAAFIARALAATGRRPAAGL
jgi:hypothetical protein